MAQVTNTITIKDAWRYRDYVIKAFNEDKPYNQFVTEQLAGDELPNPSFDAVTATGFVRLGPRVFDRDLENPNYRFDYMDDMARTAMQGFQALTINCARCHDHKFDPITRKDYYKTIAIFNSAVEYDHPLVPADQWNAYEKTANEMNAKIKDLNKQIAVIEEPYKKELFKKTLAEIPAGYSGRLCDSRRQANAGTETAGGAGFDCSFGRRRCGRLQAGGNQGERDGRRGAQGSGRPDRRAEETDAGEAACRDGHAGWRFPLYAAPAVPTRNLRRHHLRRFRLQGQVPAQAGDHYEPPPMYFASTGLGPFADEMKAPVIEPGFLTVLSKEPAKITPPDEQPISDQRTPFGFREVHRFRGQSSDGARDGQPASGISTSARAS